MRATGSGPMGALLMLAPLVAIPILAVVGIPNFAGGNLIDLNGSKAAANSREDREPQESRIGASARGDADDLFAPIQESVGSDGFEDPLSEPKRSSKSGRNRNYDDELAFNDQPRNSPPRSNTRGRAKVDDFPDPSGEPSEGFGGSDLMGGSEDVPDAGNLEDSLGESDPADNFIKETGRASRPMGIRSADISGDSGSVEAPNPFEPRSETPNRARPTPQRPSSSTAPTRQRDPLDAPAFILEDSASNDDVAAAKEPARPSTKGSSVKPRTTPRAAPIETPEGSDSTESVVPPSEPVVELTWQAATKRLRALGVGKSKQYFTYLEDRDVFLFTCQAISIQDPAKLQRFQAEADEPLLAVRQVLEELKAWQATTGKRLSKAANYSPRGHE